MKNILYIILGTLLTALLSYPFFRYKEKTKASEKFLQVFEPALLVLRNNGDITVYETLRNAFDTHQIAVNEFGRHLSGRKLSAFNQAWEDYYHNPNGKRLQQYMSTGNFEETEKRRLMALHNLESVLKFAGYNS
jgi:hypothetical protein